LLVPETIEQSHNDLVEMLSIVLASAGASEENAFAVAGQLVDAEVAGREAHGLRLIQLYVERLLNGQVSGKAQAGLSLDAGAILKVDGNRAFGQVVGDFATDIGTRRAVELGCSVVSIANAGHFGRNARWPERAAKLGVASIHFVHGFGSAANVVPFGAVEPKLRTSPIALGAPSSDGRHIILDFSVAEVSANAVRLAAERDEKLPSQSLIDTSGTLTDDPVAFMEGSASLLAFGGFKGYGMAVFAEIFAGIIGGGLNTLAGTNSMLSIYFDVKQMTDWEAYNRALAEFAADVRAARPLAGGQVVAFPGDRGRLAVERTRDRAFQIDTFARETIGKAAHRSGAADALSARWPSIFH